MTDSRTSQDLLEFPCHYQFKAVGVAGEEFRLAAIAAVRQHAQVPADAVRCRPSGKGNYQAVSILVTLHSDSQLTAIYAELRQLDGLKMLL